MVPGRGGAQLRDAGRVTARAHRWSHGRTVSIRCSASGMPARCDDPFAQDEWSTRWIASRTSAILGARSPTARFASSTSSRSSELVDAVLEADEGDRRSARGDVARHLEGEGGLAHALGAGQDGQVGRLQAEADVVVQHREAERERWRADPARRRLSSVRRNRSSTATPSVAACTRVQPGGHRSTSPISERKSTPANSAVPAWRARRRQGTYAGGRRSSRWARRRRPCSTRPSSRGGRVAASTVSAGLGHPNGRCADAGPVPGTRLSRWRRVPAGSRSSAPAPGWWRRACRRSWPRGS